MRETDKKYQCIPFWSWNDELDEKGLVEQVEWMNENGVGGFFMHARGGLKTEYLWGFVARLLQRKPFFPCKICLF